MELGVADEGGLGGGDIEVLDEEGISLSLVTPEHLRDDLRCHQTLHRVVASPH